MKRVVSIAPSGSSDRDRERAITLDYDHRHRRRIVLVTDDGEEVLLDLPEARALGDGEGLVLDDGRVVRIRAADEDVYDVTCASPRALVRVAWHLGNRHLDVQITSEGTLRIRADEVIGRMLRGLGATVTAKRAPFHPEQGAYAEHSHAHAHDDQLHEHEHGHAHAHAARHRHEP